MNDGEERIMSSADDDLNWLAMQYVLGELPEIERASFESRLIGDLRACEAVAVASRLVTGIQSAFAADLTSSPCVQASDSPRRSAWYVVAAASAAAIAFVGTAFWFSFAEDQSSQTADVVARWRAAADDSNIEADEPEDDLLEVSNLEIPDWLIAGVTVTTSEDTKEN